METTQIFLDCLLLYVEQSDSMFNVGGMHTFCNTSLLQRGNAVHFPRVFSPFTILRNIRAPFSYRDEAFLPLFLCSKHTSRQNWGFGLTQIFLLPYFRPLSLSLQFHPLVSDKCTRRNRVVTFSSARHSSLMRYQWTRLWQLAPHLASVSFHLCRHASYGGSLLELVFQVHEWSASVYYSDSAHVG